MRREKPVAFDLKASREIRNLSQADVAAILCTTQASVSRWESSGGLPAIYRKAWDQHWKLEDLANGETNRPTSKRAAGSTRRSDKARGGKKRVIKRNQKLRQQPQARDADMPVSGSVDAVEE